MKLYTAVLLAIDGLKTNDWASFSAHDVTSYIRERVNDGGWTLLEKASDAFPGGEILHEEVKEVVKDYYDNGVLFTLFDVYNVEFNGKYMSYMFTDPDDKNNDTDSENDCATAIVQTDIKSPTVVKTVDSNQSIGFDFGSDANKIKIEDEIISIVHNSEKIITLKQIQSSLKIKGLRCIDIYDILTGLDYTPYGDNKKYSTYTI